MRIHHHPILGPTDYGTPVTFFFDGQEYQGYDGEPVAAALYAAGIKTHSISHKGKRPRGIFCMIGKCTDCVMVIDGRANVRTCVTQLREGMQIQTQHGNSEIQPQTQEEP